MAVIKRLQQALTTLLQTSEKIEKLSKDIDCLSKEIEDIRKCQMEFLEWKNVLTQIKTQGMSSIAEWKDREKNP